MARLSSEFVDESFVVDQIMAAAKCASNSYYDRLVGDLDSQLRGDVDTTLPQLGDLRFDSALEAAYWAWWLAIREMDQMFSGTTLRMERHVEVVLDEKRYVLDLVLRHDGKASRLGDPKSAAYVASHWPLIAIELDGHTFHEKTREQVTNRNQRDRALQQAGWRVFHYSFDEFVKSPERCAWEPIDFAHGVAWSLRREFLAMKASKA